MRRITIKDLSKMLSLAPSTISRALQDHPDIKKETKERVNEAATKFNYVPNLHARFFRKKHSGLVALILPQFHSFFTPSLMEGIKSVINDNEYSLIIFQSDNLYKKECDLVHYCLSWVVDGVLIILSDQTKETSHLNPLKDADIPVVMLDKIVESSQFSTVSIDDVEVAREATQYLIQQGCKYVLGIFGNQEMNICYLRKVGFTKACTLRKIDYQFIVNNDLSQLPQQIANIIEEHNIDGIFTMSDELLIHTNVALKSLLGSQNSPKVIAISDGLTPHLIYPKINHFLHSGYEVGKEAAELLIKQIKNANTKIEHKKIATHLVELS